MTRQQSTFTVLFCLIMFVCSALSVVSVAFWQGVGAYADVNIVGRVGDYYIEYEYGQKADRTARSVVVNTPADSAYSNYICVKRTVDADANAVSSASVAFLNFAASGADLTATVTEFSILRSVTDASGGVTQGGSYLSVFNAPTTVADINSAYLRLDFATGANRYFALTICIATSTPTTFDFSATLTPTDTHTVPPTVGGFYLGSTIAGWDATPANLLAVTPGAEYELDRSGMLALDEGAEVKAFKYVDGVSDLWITPTALIVTPNTQEATLQANGNVKINTGGRYRVRIYGTEKSVTMELNAIELRSGAGTEVTDTPGYYVLGSFSEFKIYSGFAMAQTDYDGVYEFAAPSATGGRTIDWAFEPHDVYRVAHVSDTGVITYSAHVTAQTAISCIVYDAYTERFCTEDITHRFIFDLGELSLDAAPDIVYRTTLSGKSQSAELAVATALGSGYYVGNLNTAKLASLHFAATSSAATVNSFDIDALSVSQPTMLSSGSFEQDTYTVKRGSTPTGGTNWTGEISRGGATCSFGTGAGYTIKYLNADDTLLSESVLIADTVYTPVRYKTAIDTVDTGGGERFMLYYNGNAVNFNLSDPNARIIHTSGTCVYEIITDAHKAAGEYTVSVDSAKTHITFIGGNASEETAVTVGSAQNEGYYLVGQFSGWQAYPCNKIAQKSDIMGVFYGEADYIITSQNVADNPTLYTKADEYKIVYVPSSGTALQWIGANGVVNGMGENMTAASTTFYVDSYNKGTESAANANIFPTAEKLASIYRMVFHPDSSTSWSGYNGNHLLHYWGSGGFVGTDWNSRPVMKYVNANTYFYDISGSTGTMTGVIIVIGQTNAAPQSADLTASYAVGHSYEITFGNVWSGGYWTATPILYVP